MTTYIACPRCKGACQVFAYTELPEFGRPSVGEYFQCPLCLGTGEADAQEAAEWAGEDADAEG